MDQIRHVSTVATLPAVTTSDAPAGFATDGNPSLGIPNTKIPADWVNGVTEEIRNSIIDSGQTPSQTKLKQLASAMKTMGQRHNYILNGSMNVYQRGNSVSLAAGQAGYGPDKWKGDVTGGGYTFNLGINEFNLGAAEVNGGYCKFVRNTITQATPGVGSYALFRQYIEDVRLLGGKTVTVSMWIRTDAVRSFSIEMEQFFGTGGSPSSSIQTSPQTFALAANTWTRITATFTLPSIVGKTIGTTVNTSTTILNIWFGAGSTFNARTNTLGHMTNGYFDITKVSIDEGTVASEWVDEPVADTLFKCQRYYEKSFGDITNPVSAGGRPNSIEFAQVAGASSLSQSPSIKFKTNKRVAPTVTILNPVNANNQIYNYWVTGDWSGSYVATVASTGFTVAGTTNAGSSAPNMAAFHFTADSDF
jgi:hypothetical protein